MHARELHRDVVINLNASTDLDIVLYDSEDTSLYSEGKTFDGANDTD
jgi:hypothetical protein